MRDDMQQALKYAQRCQRAHLPSICKQQKGCWLPEIAPWNTIDHRALSSASHRENTRRQGLQKSGSGARTLPSQEYVQLLWVQAEGAPADLPATPLGAGLLLLSGDSSLCLRGCSRTGFTKDSHRRCSSSCVRNVSPAHQQQLCWNCSNGHASCIMPFVPSSVAVSDATVSETPDDQECECILDTLCCVSSYLCKECRCSRRAGPPLRPAHSPC